MKKQAMWSVLALFVLATVIGIGGALAGWFFRGFSPAEVEQLDRDWAQVVAWANLPAPDSGLNASTAAFVKAIRKVDLPDVP
jgi:hypothetical protein